MGIEEYAKENEPIKYDGNNYLTYQEVHPCEYLPNLDKIYFGMSLDMAKEYLEEEGFEVDEDTSLKGANYLLNDGNLNWKCLDNPCGVVFWEELNGGKVVRGIKLQTYAMDREAAEEAYSGIKEYYLQFFNAGVMQEETGDNKYMKCGLTNNIAVDVEIHDDEFGPDGFEFYVLFGKY